MPKPRPSVLKRQREQLKRDKKAQKAEKRSQRKTEDPVEGEEFGENPVYYGEDRPPVV